MKPQHLSIRPFIGAKDFALSRSFYSDLGFEEKVIHPGFSLFQSDTIAFYLQDAFVKDWIDNTMIFIEVSDVEAQWNHLSGLNLTKKYETVKLTPIRYENWGKECFLHDPSGILWHFGAFN